MMGGMGGMGGGCCRRREIAGFIHHPHPVRIQSLRPRKRHCTGTRHPIRRTQRRHQSRPITRRNPRAKQRAPYVSQTTRGRDTGEGDTDV
jgi:hypothetical protein